jgi:thiopeptide-type bacteriocin biosynthesis protein
VRSRDRMRFESTGAALLRAVPYSRLDLPPWPDLADPARDQLGSWVDWLREVWKIDAVAEAVSHASPVLAAQVRTVCAAKDPAVRETWRTMLSVARYLLRMTGRPTPFGLLAGVASVSFAEQPRVNWGGGHRAIARAGADWLAEIVTRLEGCPEVLARLPVAANSTIAVRGDRLIVPYQPSTGEEGTEAVEVSLRHTAAVRVAVDAAHTPVPFEDLAAKLRAEFPAAAPAAVVAMLTEMVARRALITSLHAPSTVPDALGHLVRELEAAGASGIAAVAELVHSLREIHVRLERHNQASIGDARALREEVTMRMRDLAGTERHPLAVDLRLDAALVLPQLVAREVERAALVLTRLSAFPYGTPTWREYHQRFYERFGIGSMVPLPDVVADSGIGWPDGYPGTVTAERRSPMSRRDEVLLSLAQTAALDGRDEVVVDEALLAALDIGPNRPRTPPHLELCVRVHAADLQALHRGEFRLEVVSVSRAAGTLTGRFLSVLEPQDQSAHLTGLSDLPAGDGETVAVQMSFPPLDPASAHVARSVQVLPVVISLAEHRAPGGQVLTAKDLAVGCDGRRMYLAAPARGHRVEAVGMHALNLRTYTPPLARLLSELSRAQNAQVTVFSWGAAERLPFLPRVRYGRTILAPARWRLEAVELPGRTEPWAVWDDALASWRRRRRLPQLVHLAEGDRRLPLDLDQAGHRVLLRAHLNTAPHAVLVEAPGENAFGWCGGRAHEVIVPVKATEPPPWPRLPKPSPARIIDRGLGQAPGASRVLLASLYGDIHRQDVLLAEHVPVLLARLGQPAWWYVRYRDPDHHLRLRIALPDPTAFGEVSQVVSTWADELHRVGLLREVTYPTSYPETGRWGSGPAMAAAEKVFGADSQATLAQLGLPECPNRQALVAAHTVAIAVAFTGGIGSGMQWLIEHVPAAAPAQVPRPVFTEAIRIADPRDDWTSLRETPGGASVITAWAPRAHALAEYRAHFPAPDTEGIAVDDVLGSLMHVNYVRACGIDFDDEAVCLYLARCAALAWSARTADGRR